MRAAVLISAAIASASGAAPGGTQASAETIFSIRPVAAADSVVTDADIEGWASRANELLQQGGASPWDVPCDAKIVIAKKIVRDASLKNLALTEADKNKLKAVKTCNVVIVDDLRWCDGKHDTTVAGCEGSGAILIITQNTSAYQTLAHELGHRFDLHHTWNGIYKTKVNGTTKTVKNCSTPPPAEANISEQIFVNLMYCRGHKNRLTVTKEQCDNFLNGEFADLPEVAEAANKVGVEETVPQAGAAEPVTTEEPAEVQEATERPTDIEEFLTYGFEGGTPYGVIDALTEEDITKIRSVLADPARKEQWSNAAIVLALRGGTEDATLLNQVLEASVSGEDAAEIRARTSAAFGLGLLSQRFPEANARNLPVLVNGVSLAQARVVSPNHDPEGLARAFALAVAYSGDIAATKAVIDLAAAGGRIAFDENKLVADYAEGKSLAPEERADLPETPVFEADFVEMLAATALGVSDQGLKYLRQPTAATPANSLKALEAEVRTKSVQPGLKAVIGRFNLDRLPEWNSLMLRP